MNLTQIKDEVARRYGYEDWDSIYQYDFSMPMVDEIAKAYAIACQEQLRRDIADNAYDFISSDSITDVDEAQLSILETPLIK